MPAFSATNLATYRGTDQPAERTADMHPHGVSDAASIVPADRSAHRATHVCANRRTDIAADHEAHHFPIGATHHPTVGAAYCDSHW